MCHFARHNRIVKENCIWRDKSSDDCKKTGSDCADVMWCGKLFQTREAATGKARWPYVDSRVRVACSNVFFSERYRIFCSSFFFSWLFSGITVLLRACGCVRRRFYTRFRAFLFTIFALFLASWLLRQFWSAPRRFHVAYHMESYEKVKMTHCRVVT